MKIDVVYDPSVNAGNFASGTAEEKQFKDDITYVVDLYDKLFTNNVTFTIDVGWGEFGQKTSANPTGSKNGTPINPNNAIAQNHFTLATNTYNYTQIKDALKDNAGGQQSDQAIFAALPNSDPLATNTFVLPVEQAAVLGLLGTGGFVGSGDNVGFLKTLTSGGSWY